MTRSRTVATAVLLLAAALPALPAHSQLRELLGLGGELTKPWTGDLDGMVERRVVRMLVVPSRTFYFVDKGTQRGLSYDRGKAFEEDLNRKLGKRILKVEVVFVPVTHEEIIPALLQGRGDVAAANLTITPERQQWVDFSAPLWTRVDEIVVTGPASPPIRSLDDLAGQEIFVRLSSSYFQSLWHLNESFGPRGLPPVVVKPAPEELEDEDILEMLNAGLVKLAVVDGHKAEFWARIFSDIELHPDVAVRTGGEIAFAFRKQSPQLQVALDDFAKRHGKGTAFGNTKFREYLKSTKYVESAGSKAELAKFLRTIQLFQKYAAQYDFDWLMLAAQGYQESRLDQSVKSPVGAIGIMQVMPATGQELGVGDIRQIEANVHAGTKYLRTVMDRHFPEAQFDPLNRCLFAFASYNAGPNRIAKLRKEAEKRGLDPNAWFQNVELVVAERVGQETVRYVSNIFKYYVAYKLVVDAQAERERARREARAG
jgi:membrane-bound lytic murein transglycosylase MltF